MASLLQPTKRYATAKESLSPEDCERLEYEEQRIASGEEDYRADERGEFQTHYFDYGLIRFRRLTPDLVQLVAFSLFDRL